MNEPRTVFLAIVSVPDGYFGKRTAVFLVYDPGTLMTYEVYSHGFHSSYVPMAIDEEEARWLLNNHPTAQKRYKNIKEV